MQIRAGVTTACASGSSTLLHDFQIAAELVDVEPSFLERLAEFVPADDFDPLVPFLGELRIPFVPRTRPREFRSVEQLGPRAFSLGSAHRGRRCRRGRADSSSSVAMTRMSIRRGSCPSGNAAR